MSNPSICIPKINVNTPKHFIKNIFEKHNLGKIKKIHIVSTNKFNKAFIHFEYWYDNVKSLKVREYLNNQLDFKIMYNEPWYWKCFVYFKKSETK